MIALIVIGFFTVYFVANVLYVALRNYKAHQFFRLKSPQLPSVPNPNIFYGNIKQVTWSHKNWRNIDELHKKYGTSFGFYVCEQPWVSTTDLDLIKLIELDKPKKHINRTKINIPMKEFHESIFQVDDDQWRRVRRAISPALNNHKVRSDEVTSDIKDILNQLSESLKRRADKAEHETGKPAFVLDFIDIFQRYSLAVIFSIAYKKENVINFDKNKDEWVEIFEAGKRDILSPVVMISLMFPFMQSTCNFLLRLSSLGQLYNKILDYITEATDMNRTAREFHDKHQKRMSISMSNYKERPFEDLKRTGNFKRRLVDTMIDSYLDRKISHSDFVATAFFLMIAGFETTASTITCLLWQLARYPEIQEKLRETIKIEGIDASYVEWCIMETIRWHPAVPLGTGRVLGEDVTVNGITYAKGSFIMPSTHTIHRDASIWPEPEAFKPERWANAKEFHPAAFMGFGLGPRNCVGGKLAVQEIKLILQMLLTCYRIEKCDETSDTYDFSSPGLIYTNLDKPIKARLVALGGGEGV